MPSDVRIRFGTAATYPGSPSGTVSVNNARDLSDSTRSTTPSEFTLGYPFANGLLLSNPDPLPGDLGTLDSVDLRIRIRHDAGPLVPGIIENFHAVYFSYDSGATWTQLEGGENALPTARDSEVTRRLTLSPGPSAAEWSGVQVLLQNWVGSPGSGTPSDP